MTESLIIIATFCVWAVLQDATASQHRAVAEYYRARIRKPLPVQLACRHWYSAAQGCCTLCGITEAEYRWQQTVCRYRLN